MTTLEKSVKKNLEKTASSSQTSSQGASLANRFRSRANKKERVTTDISGQRCFESSKSLPRGGLLEKMSKALLTSKTAWSSRLCVLTWKEKVTKSGRSIFQLQASAPRIDVKDSGLLPTEKNLWSTPTTFDSNNITKPRKNHPGGGQVPPLNQQVMWSTPTTMDHLPQRSEEALRRQATTTRKGRTRPANLREQVDENAMRIWRTPDAHCNRGPSSEKRMKMKLKKGMPISINDQVAHPNLMWPTPRANEPGRTTKGYGRGLAELVEGKKQVEPKKMWPTPSRGMYKQDVNDNGEYAKRIKDKGHQIMLPAAVKLREPKRNWPTARDWKDSGKAVVNSPRHSLPQTVAKSNKEQWIKGGGALNPTWVEWLMGYPAGYTDLKHWEILSSRKLRKK